MSPSRGRAPVVFAVVPAYNEEGRVAEVVEAARKELPVVTVDDGSGDATARRAEEAGATVLRQVPNRGKGAALRAGFHWALEHGADAVITLDADGQHDPAEIPRFLACFLDTAPDLVIGARDFSGMPPVRRLSNSIGRNVFSWAIGRPVADNQSGYRLLSRRLLEAVLSSREAGFEFEMEMIVIAAERGFRIASVPIRTIYTGEGSHIRPIPHVVHFLRVAVQTRHRLRRNIPLAPRPPER